MSISSEQKTVYRKHIDAGWISVGDNTWVMRVPNGMVMRSGNVMSNGNMAMTFVPCDDHDMRAFLSRYGV